MPDNNSPIEKLVCDECDLVVIGIRPYLDPVIKRHPHTTTTRITNVLDLQDVEIGWPTGTELTSEN
jgi:hypothetical protein